jgi:DNA-binding beta-propeller fold protein YncE
MTSTAREHLGTRGRRSRRVALAIVALALLLPAAAWAVGELTQKPGLAGCITETGSAGECRDGVALDESEAVVVSPDGTSVYVASYGRNAVAIFDRSTTAGELVQKAGTAACMSDNGTAGACQDGTALAGARGVAVSPDGANVYVAARNSDAVAIFDRDPATGALVQKAGTAGCVSETGAGPCQDGWALDGPAAVAVSPDGKSVYVASEVSDAVAVLDRDPATGALVQKAGPAGCVSDTGAGPCQNGVGLDGARALTVSHDGKNVYVASEVSDAVAILDRSAAGELTQKAGTAGCVSDTGAGPCQDGVALDGARAVAASPDGKTVYVASTVAGAVAILDRDPDTGALAQKAGTAGCVSDTGTAGACQDGTALAFGRGVAVSPDGESVYVLGSGADAVAILDRNTAGELTQKAGTAGCVSETGTAGACQDGAALDSPWGITTSSDGKSVYVVTDNSSGVAILDRVGPAAPPQPQPQPPAADTTAASVSGFSLTRKRFRVARQATAVSARAAARRRPAPRGSAFRFALSEQATARIAIERALPGRRVGTRCRKPSRTLQGRRRCTRYTRAGTLTRASLQAGQNTVKFSGRIGRRALKPGRYRVTIIATDAAGNRSKPRRATFTVVRR